MSDANPVYIRSSSQEPLRQGEILSALPQHIISAESIVAGQTVDLLLVTHALVIVVSQDCDLDQEYKARNRVPNPQGNIPRIETQIPNILFCEVYPADELRSLFGINSGVWGQIKPNNYERYQYLREVPRSFDALDQGLPALAIDFKRHFTIRADEAYARLARGVQRRCRLNTPYVEHLSSRFAAYLSRVALPNPH